VVDEHGHDDAQSSRGEPHEFGPHHEFHEHEHVHPHEHEHERGAS